MDRLMSQESWRKFAQRSTSDRTNGEVNGTKCISIESPSTAMITSPTMAECIFSHPFHSFWPSDKKSLRHLQDFKREGTNVCISNLAHFTTESKADAIIRSGGFRGGMKKIDEDSQGDDIKARFSWWSPKFDENDITKVRDTLGEAISPFLHDERDDQDTLQNQFATSDAFIPNPWRYGSSYFQYDIDDLCQCYGVHFHGKVQFKILGTFSYKKEVIHAVLACSQTNGAGMFRAYPKVLTPEEDVDNEAVVTRDDDGNWVWKPQATGTEITRLDAERLWQTFPMYRRWENVAFAFHIPDEWEDKYFMVVPDLDKHLHQIKL
ncbi:uncharacterized protein LOC144664098 [Oculina patagonica]